MLLRQVSKCNLSSVFIFDDTIFLSLYLFFIEHIDDSKFMLFDEFNKQAIESNVYKCLPNNVYIFDPYMVHRSPLIDKKTERYNLSFQFL